MDSKAPEKIPVVQTDQMIHLRIPHDIHKLVRQEAASRDVELGTITQVVNEALVEYLRALGRL